MNTQIILSTLLVVISCSNVLTAPVTSYYDLPSTGTPKDSYSQKDQSFSPSDAISRATYLWNHPQSDDTSSLRKRQDQGTTVIPQSNIEYVPEQSSSVKNGLSGTTGQPTDMVDSKTRDADQHSGHQDQELKSWPSKRTPQMGGMNGGFNGMGMGGSGGFPGGMDDSMGGGNMGGGIMGGGGMPGGMGGNMGQLSAGGSGFGGGGMMRKLRRSPQVGGMSGSMGDGSTLEGMGMGGGGMSGGKGESGLGSFGGVGPGFGEGGIMRRLRRSAQTGRLIGSPGAADGEWHPSKREVLNAPRQFAKRDDSQSYASTPSYTTQDDDNSGYGNYDYNDNDNDNNNDKYNDTDDNYGYANDQDQDTGSSSYSPDGDIQTYSKAPSPYTSYSD